MSEVRQSESGITGRRHTGSRRAVVLFAAALALLLPSLGTKGALATGANSPTRATRANTLVVAISHDVETLDSDFSHYPLANEVNYNTQDQYFIYGMKQAGGGYREEVVTKIKPKSIASWKFSKNGLSAVLHVQPGNRFCHTGNPVTAADYVYYFKRGIHTKSGYLFNIAGAFIKGWNQLGKYGFKLTFSRPSPFFFYLFRDQSQAPVDMLALQKHATKSDPWATKWKAKHDAGSGPYCVSRWAPGTEMDLTANPYYRGPGKPHFKQVVLKVIPNSSERALLLKTGSVDIAEGLTTDEVNSLRGTSGVKILDVPSRDQYEVGLNSKKAPFTNKLVRQALSYAVPYGTIMNSVFGGHALTPRGAMPDRGLMFDPSTWPYSYNLTKAKQLLAKAGYAKGFKFTLDITAGDAISQNLAVALQSSLTKIGVQMTINPQTAAIFAQQLDNKSHQAWLEDVLWYVNDPAYVGNSFYKCGALLNWTNYCNGTVDATINKMLKDWKPSQRAAKGKLASKMQRLINADAPTLILAEPDLQIAMRSSVGGYVSAPDEELLYNYFTGKG